MEMPIIDPWVANGPTAASTIEPTSTAVSLKARETWPRESAGGGMEVAGWLGREGVPTTLGLRGRSGTGTGRLLIRKSFPVRSRALLRPVARGRRLDCR